MTPDPTGRLTRLDPAQYDLTLKRRFRAPIEDVWASLTESNRTERWYGPWRGESGIGRTIEVQMGFEEDASWMTMQIDACDAPRRLALSATNDYGVWRLELTLSEAGGVTELEFVQHLDDTTPVENIGPGWEFYLDMLVASREDKPLPAFEDYYPAQQAYYADQAAAAG